MISSNELERLINGPADILQAWCASPDYNPAEMLWAAIELKRHDLIQQAATSGKIKSENMAYWVVRIGDIEACRILQSHGCMTCYDLLVHAVALDVPDMIALAREWQADNYDDCLRMLLSNRNQFTATRMIQLIRLVLSWGGVLTPELFKCALSTHNADLDVVRFVWRNLPCSNDEKLMICGRSQHHGLLLDTLVTVLHLFDEEPRRFGWMWLAAFSLMIDGYLVWTTPETQRVAAITERFTSSRSASMCGSERHDCHQRAVEGRITMVVRGSIICQ
jgi:hypothetical protein